MQQRLDVGNRAGAADTAKKNGVMIRLICDSLPFYAQVHTCSPSYTDEE